MNRKMSREMCVGVGGCACVCMCVCVWVAGWLGGSAT